MSESFLSQEEVDALLEGVTGESQKLSEELQEQGEVRAYSISSQERIVRGRMPSMEIVNERFARNLRVGLFNMIRRSPEISLGPVAVQRYSAFLRELAVPTNFNIMAIRPLRGSGLIVCEPALLFGIIEMLYGGVGKFKTRIEGREFSQTEQRIINRLVGDTIEELLTASMAPAAGSANACSRAPRTETSGAAAPDAKAYTYSPPHVVTRSDDALTGAVVVSE
jgi:flagellar motor switch protein FliM